MAPWMRRPQEWHIPLGEGPQRAAGPQKEQKLSEAFKSIPPLPKIHSASRAGAILDAEDLSFAGTGSRPQPAGRHVLQSLAAASP
jgi:hypothetical protein